MILHYKMENPYNLIMIKKESEYSIKWIYNKEKFELKNLIKS
jgi:hypothetical protein